MEFPLYKYQPLAHGSFIRIIHVGKSTNHQQPICTFDTINLSTKFCKYTAISYTWGDPAPVRRLKCSDGQLLGISKTISDLLDSLLRREKSVTMFIDALCINQNDLEEKAHQVRLMKHVYSQADKVLVWLGEGDGQTHKAFQFMKEGISGNIFSNEVDRKGIDHHLGSDAADPLAQEPPHERKAVVDAFKALLERRWFQRVWVIQEVILGTSVMVACGDDDVDFDTFKSAFISIIHSEEILLDFDARQPSFLGFCCVTKLLKFKDEFRKNGKIELDYMLEAMFFYSATDSRDFIFAIRGLSDWIHLLPVPDYSVDAASIFKKTAENIFCKGGALDGLSMCGIGPKVQASSVLRPHGHSVHKFSNQLPSWVPDFRQLTYDEPILSRTKGGWCAGGPIRNAPSRLDGYLQVDAILLDKIVRVGRGINTTDFESLRKSLLDVLDMTSNALNEVLLHPQKIPDKVWRTLIMNLDLELQPAPAHLESAFVDLLQAVNSEHSWEEITKNEFYRNMRMRTTSWTPFVASHGCFGLTWPIVEEGDYLYLLPGCSFPLIIHPVNEENSGLSSIFHGELVGWCYVHNIMHGEALREQRKSEKIILL